MEFYFVSYKLQQQNLYYKNCVRKANKSRGE